MDIDSNYAIISHLLFFFYFVDSYETFFFRTGRVVRPGTMMRDVTLLSTGNHVMDGGKLVCLRMVKVHAHQIFRVRINGREINYSRLSIWFSVAAGSTFEELLSHP